MTALCRAICVFIIPQNAIKCNRAKTLPVFMRRIKTPLRRREIILAETKGLADADLAKSPAATGVIPPFCGGFLDCRIENPPRLRGNRNDLTAHSLSNLLVVEPAITDCKTFVQAFVPTGYNKNAHFGRFYYNWRRRRDSNP